MRSTVLVTLSILSHVALIAAIIFGPRLFRETQNSTEPKIEPVIAVTPPAPAEEKIEPTAPVVEPAPVAEVAAPIPAPRVVVRHKVRSIPVKPIITKFDLEEKPSEDGKVERPVAEKLVAKEPILEKPVEEAPVLVRIKETSPGGVEGVTDSTENAAVETTQKQELDSKPVTASMTESVQPEVQEAQEPAIEAASEPLIVAPTKAQTKVGESN